MNNNDMSSLASTTSASTAANQSPRTRSIDIEQLAERVYRLMQADLRLTRARGGTARIRKVVYGC